MVIVPRAVQMELVLRGAITVLVRSRGIQAEFVVF